LARFRILRLLFSAQQKGESQSLEMLAHHLEPMGLDSLKGHLSALRQAYFLATTDTSEWVLARDLSDVTLRDLYNIQPGVLPDAEMLKVSSKPEEIYLGEIIEQVNRLYDETMATPLCTFYRMDKVNLKPVTVKKNDSCKF
jgi:hypothetical protein